MRHKEKKEGLNTLFLKNMLSRIYPIGVYSICLLELEVMYRYVSLGSLSTRVPSSLVMVFKFI